MSCKIAVFADISNQWFCINKKWPGRKLDYEKWMASFAQYGTLYRAIAYGAQMENEASAFIHCLRNLSFEIKYKRPKVYHDGVTESRKADWDVGLAIDIVRLLPRIDTVILGSADGDLLPVVEYAREHGANVIVSACNISRDLKDGANSYVEIGKDLLI